MIFEHYIFVDYENVQGVDLDSIDEKTKVLIFVGINQKKIPIDLILKTQPYGEAVEWVRIKETKGKKNELDFFIAYFLGSYITHNSAAYPDVPIEYIVYAKDAGYDPLIKHLKELKVPIRRITTFMELRTSPLNDENTEIIKKIQENLSKIDSKKRPKTKKSLAGHLKALFNVEAADSLIEEMFLLNLMHEENGHLKYTINQDVL
ncbi:MAG: hypothetical protein LBQ77_07580 [Treponema sp.]|nr:hypothetical protein [Treponema sp.]